VDALQQWMAGAALALAVGGAPAPDSAASFPPPATRAVQTGLLRADRMEHLSLSLTLGAGLGAVTRRPSIVAAGTLALGLAKEMRDRRSGSGFDRIDLLADLLGTVLAVAVTRALD
jgi:hypothetical protein